MDAGYGRDKNRRLALMALTGIAVVGSLLAVFGCASTDDGVSVSDTRPADEGEADPQPPTTSAPMSRGVVEIGDTLYSFNVTCHDLGVRELLVLGVGAESEGAQGIVELFVRDFPDAPYVGLRLADGTRLEPSLDSSLALIWQDDRMLVSGVRFVKDLDLETGEATTVGLGGLDINCGAYSTDLLL